MRRARLAGGRKPCKANTGTPRLTVAGPLSGGRERFTLCVMLRRWRKRVPACRRAIALLVLCGFVVTFVGVPVPVVAPGKGLSRSAASTNHRCCCQSAANGAGQCCGHCGCGKRKAAATVATQEAPQFELVLSILARKCQGHAEIWLALGALALPPERAAVMVDQPCCGRIAIVSIALHNQCSAPATPPPRV